jgi:hypothetical protein
LAAGGGRWVYTTRYLGSRTSYLIRLKKYLKPPRH